MVAGLNEVCDKERFALDGNGRQIQYPHILPKLTYANAQRFNGNFFVNDYWFPLGEWKKRKEFIRWLMDEYKDDKTDLRTINV